MLCPRHLPAALSVLPCPSARGRWWGIRGSYGDRGVAGSRAGRTPAAWHGSGRSPRQGSGRGPAAEGGCGFFRGIQPGCAFRRSPAVPHGTSMLRLSALPCASARGVGTGKRGFGSSLGMRVVTGSRAGEGGSEVVVRSGEWFQGVRGIRGRCGLAGRGMPAALHGSRRSPRQGIGLRPALRVGSGFSVDQAHAAPFGASLRFGSGYWREEAGSCGVSLRIGGVTSSRAEKRLRRGRRDGGIEPGKGVSGFLMYRFRPAPSGLSLLWVSLIHDVSSAPLYSLVLANARGRCYRRLGIGEGWWISASDGGERWQEAFLPIAFSGVHGCLSGFGPRRQGRSRWSPALSEGNGLPWREGQKRAERSEAAGRAAPVGGPRVKPRAPPFEQGLSGNC